MMLATGELVRFGVAGRPLEADSGDAFVVAPFDAGVLIAVLDGLGHGSRAAFAARTAQQALLERPGDPVERLLSACHDALRRTRGAVVSLAAVDRAGGLTWAGVGDVEAAIVRRRSSQPARVLAAAGGILGHSLPEIRPDSETLAPGDVLVFATDGIKPGSFQLAEPGAAPRANADRILAEGWTGRDDALVLVARYLGAQP